MSLRKQKRKIDYMDRFQVVNLLERQMSEVKTDLDLAPAYRTQANLWKARFFEMREAVIQANKGIRRLRRKLNALQQAAQTDTKHRCEFCGDIIDYGSLTNYCPCSVHRTD